MLVIYAELWPGGDESKRRVLGNMAIVNDTPTGVLEREDGTGLYRVVIDGEPLRGRRVRHHRRDNVWRLIGLAIRRYEERR